MYYLGFGRAENLLSSVTRIFCHTAPQKNQISFDYFFIENLEFLTIRNTK